MKKLKVKTQLIVIKNIVKILTLNKCLPSSLCEEIKKINKDTNVGYVSFLIKLTQNYIQPKNYYISKNDYDANLRIKEACRLFIEANNL